MIELRLVGIGTGNPAHLTAEGRHAIASADLVLLPRKGAEKLALAHLRRRILADIAPAGMVREFDMPERATEGDYAAAVGDWHDEVSRCWAEELKQALPGGGSAALMVWGDPSLYDSSLRIAARLGLRPRVVPGITALQALTAAHAIPLNSVGAPVVITTGRRLRAGGWPSGAETVAVMLDRGCAFEALEPAGIHIWWGAYLGMDEEILAAGPLAATAPGIRRRRAEARARHGWIMDIYLMRRGAG